MAISKFTQYTDALLSINNPNVLFDRMETTNNTLFDKFINNPFNIQLQSDLYIQKTPIYTHNELTWKTTAGMEGFNQVKIAETSPDPISLLPYIDESKVPAYNSLLTIQNTISKDYKYYELSKQMQNNYKTELIHDLFIENYFMYLYGFQDSNYISKDNEPVSLTFLTYYLYVQVYDKVVASLFWELDPENFISREDLIQEFTEYLEGWGNSLAFDFGNFLLSNVMTLSDTSPLYKNNIKNAVKTQYPKMKEIFIDNIEDLASNFYYQQIISSVLKNFSIYMTIANRKNLHTYRFESDIHNDENLIFDNMVNKLSTEKSLDLQSQSFITYQFNDNYLYFINSHAFTYNFWNNLLIEELFMDDLLTPETVREWMGNILIFENQNNFINNLGNYNIQEELVNSKSVEYSCGKWFNEFLDAFINTEEFHDYIIGEFSSSVIAAIQEYYPESSEYVYDNIDKIKLFFKMRFTKDVLSGKMFSKTANRVYDQFDTITIPLGIRPNILNDIVKTFKSPSSTEIEDYRKHLLDIYQSSFLALFTHHNLDGYRL